MKILILHKNNYYGNGLKEALTSFDPQTEVTFCHLVPSAPLTDYNIILADTDSLRLICRNSDDVFYDTIKVILLKNPAEQTYAPTGSYDTFIADTAPVEEIFKEIQIVQNIPSQKMLRQRPRHDRLSTREYQIALCLLENKRSKEIAMLLGLNEKTISTYKQRVFHKFKIKSLLELREAMRNVNII